MLSDHDFMRYSRQLLLEDIGAEGQLKLRQSHAVVIGLGGLGSPAALYLAAAGVGELTLIDDDDIHISNLQRQILYTEADVQANKAQTATARLRALNPSLHLNTITAHQTRDTLQHHVKQADVVLDCTDNMTTRHAINAACVTQRKTLVSGSAVGFSGQLLVLTPPFEHGCYCCLYPDDVVPERNCRTAGVLGPVVGVIGTLQALEAIKLLAGLPSALNGKLRLFDGKQQSWSTLQLQRAALCPVCGEAAVCA